MAKALDFADYSATTEDDDGDKHVSTVRAAVVDKDTAGEYNVRGTSTNVKPGDVLVETDRAGVYDHHPADAWKDTGYAAKKAPAASAAKKATAPAKKASAPRKR